MYKESANSEMWKQKPNSVATLPPQFCVTQHDVYTSCIYDLRLAAHTHPHIHQAHTFFMSHVTHICDISSSLAHSPSLNGVYIYRSSRIVSSRIQCPQRQAPHYAIWKLVCTYTHTDMNADNSILLVEAPTRRPHNAHSHKYAPTYLQIWLEWWTRHRHLSDVCSACECVSLCGTMERWVRIYVCLCVRVYDEFAMLEWMCMTGDMWVDECVSLDWGLTRNRYLLERGAGHFIIRAMWHNWQSRLV